MPPKTKTGTAKTLLGQPSSVLSNEFLQAVNEQKPDADILPFSRPMQLPTVEQVVKLYFFYKEQAGVRNSKVSQEDICIKVSAQVVKYWKMAGFKTMSEIYVRKNIKKEVEKYQNMNKNKNRVSQTENDKRMVYMGSVKKLFDIAALDLEEILRKDRVLGNDDECPLYRIKEGYTRRTEDFAFLADQRGERKMEMAERDISFEARKDLNMQRSSGKTGGEGVNIESENVHIEPEDIAAGETDVIDEDDKDFDFETKKKTKKKEDFVLVELPKDIMNNPDVVAMLDRTATTSRHAVGIVSSILKSGKIDGQGLDLNKFTLSRNSLERKRDSNRSVLMEQAMLEFQQKKPRYAALHWDGALVKDVTGTLQENESILVSGAPHYLEGKLLSVS